MSGGFFISLIFHLRVSIPRLMISLGFLDGQNQYLNFKYKIINKNIAAIIKCNTK